MDIIINYAIDFHANMTTILGYSISFTVSITYDEASSALQFYNVSMDTCRA